MKKRHLKKHLFKGNCPVCLSSSKVSFMRNQWVIVACDCGYKEER